MDSPLPKGQSHRAVTKLSALHEYLGITPSGGDPDPNPDLMATEEDTSMDVLRDITPRRKHSGAWVRWRQCWLILRYRAQNCWWRNTPRSLTNKTLGRLRCQNGRDEGQLIWTWFLALARERRVNDDGFPSRSTTVGGPLSCPDRRETADDATPNHEEATKEQVCVCGQLPHRCQRGSSTATFEGNPWFGSGSSRLLAGVQCPLGLRCLGPWTIEHRADDYTVLTCSAGHTIICRLQ